MADEQESLPTFIRGDRIALVLLCAGLLALIIIYECSRLGVSKNSAQLTPGGKMRPHVVNLNKAEWWELQALEGIGPKRAQDIVAYREQKGVFHSVDDLAQVHGIGPKTIDRLRQSLTVTAETADEQR